MARELKLDLFEEQRGELEPRKVMLQSRKYFSSSVRVRSACDDEFVVFFTACTRRASVSENKLEINYVF